jgi:hypothetical protein
MHSGCRIQHQEGSIIKREWWRKWDRDYIPELEHVIQSYDTAFLKKRLPIFLRSLLGVYSIQILIQDLI